jgi:hypothetical protein
MSRSAINCKQSCVRQGVKIVYIYNRAACGQSDFVNFLQIAGFRPLSGRIITLDYRNFNLGKSSGGRFPAIGVTSHGTDMP